jgi:hypothetical protein
MAAFTMRNRLPMLFAGVAGLCCTREMATARARPAATDPPQISGPATRPRRHTRRTPLFSTLPAASRLALRPRPRPRARIARRSPCPQAPGSLLPLAAAEPAPGTALDPKDFKCAAAAAAAAPPSPSLPPNLSSPPQPPANRPSLFCSPPAAAAAAAAAGPSSWPRRSI